MSSDETATLRERLALMFHDRTCQGVETCAVRPSLRDRKDADAALAVSERFWRDRIADEIAALKMEFRPSAKPSPKNARLVEAVNGAYVHAARIARGSSR